MAHQLDGDCPEGSEQPQLEQVLERVLGMAEAGQVAELRSFLANVLQFANASSTARKQAPETLAGSRVVATFVGPLAELWAEDTSLVGIKRLARGSRTWLEEFERLASQLDKDIARRLPYPDAAGIPRAFNDMDLDEAIDIVGDIVELQVDGHVRLQKVLPMNLLAAQGHR